MGSSSNRNNKQNMAYFMTENTKHYTKHETFTNPTSQMCKNK